MQVTHNDKRGFTLIETIIVMLIIGIVAAVAMRKMNKTVESAQYEQTKKEMDHLAMAIVGNPEVYSRGARTDFGYVGDVGAFPNNLDDLVTNPGYATWDGPYVKRTFDNNAFKQDGWGTNYTYSDTLIRSTGSGSDIDKKIATSSAVLSNAVAGYIVDANRQMASGAYKDSVLVSLIYPDGSGGTSVATVNPDDHGQFAFSGIPIGNHTLRVVYTPDTDTTTYSVAVYPGKDVALDIVFPADLW